MKTDSYKVSLTFLVDEINSDNVEDQNDVTKLASDLSSLEVSYFRRIVSRRDFIS